MVKRIISIIVIVILIVGMPFSNLSRDIEAGIFLVKNEESKSNKKPFIEETKEGQDINDYERELYKRFIEESESVETTERKESGVTKEIADRIESIIAEKIAKRIEKSTIESASNQKVVLNAKYDRHEIYTEKNSGIVKVSDDNSVYYNNKANVKFIRDMIDENGNSPILLNFELKVKLFDFDDSDDNYVLLPEQFVEELISRESGNKYLNPKGINRLNHIKVDLIYNNTDFGKHYLYEYDSLYYLCFYEGVAGDYYQ